MSSTQATAATAASLEVATQKAPTRFEQAKSEQCEDIISISV